MLGLKNIVGDFSMLFDMSVFEWLCCHEKFVMKKQGV